MHEKIPEGLTPEQPKEQEEKARYSQWMKDHPDTVTVPENRKECKQEIVELESLIEAFKSEYSIEALNLILISEEAFEHPVREPAKKALALILGKLHFLGDETNISHEKYKELEARFGQISDAVGIINVNGGKYEYDENTGKLTGKIIGGTVDHDRYKNRAR